MTESTIKSMEPRWTLMPTNQGFGDYQEVMVVWGSSSTCCYSITTPVEILPSTGSGIPFYVGGYYNSSNAYYGYVLLTKNRLEDARVVKNATEITRDILKVYAR